ncbi:hypothetical protein [Microbispora bryophytorum]|uniref:HNH endonuclease n=1 Tax=Microbispora bryophytorum subsp. camponoti TaxID=1677852 RepID=A0ABR8L6Z2_9ACTN|nr:hypothetical protein [Microbispora camponoti]MBD3144253.1 hypothetical protein [Microbispora camponoti]
MRFRSLVISLCAVLASAGLLVVPLAAQAAPAGTSSASAGCYRQVGDHWECVTPGAFCPAAAHGRNGTAQDGDSYRCVQDGSYWRWKPAGSSGGAAPKPTAKPKPTVKPKPTAKPARPKCSQKYLPLPDPKCQPGTRNPAVTQRTIKSTICTPGYSRKAAPPASYTNALRVTQIAQYGYADRKPSHYKEDHLIPLSLGGSPKSVKNLWPEPVRAGKGKTPAAKDTVELTLWRAVCHGRVPLAKAQQAIAKNWRTAVRRLGL